MKGLALSSNKDRLEFKGRKTPSGGVQVNLGVISIPYTASPGREDLEAGPASGPTG